MTKNKERLTGKPYEELIFKIYKELEPYAEIKKNDRIIGFESKNQREIDISIRQKIAGHEIFIIIQGKDHKKRADIKILGEFDSVVRDVRASKGILICNSGFTRTAKDYAASRGIDLYTVHDASIKDWQDEIKVPVVRTHTTMTYGLLMPIEITKEIQEFYKNMKTKVRLMKGPEGVIMKKFDESETTFLKEFMKAWEEKKIDTSPGTHKITFEAYVDMFDNKTLFPPKPTQMEYKVKARHFLKFFTPTDYRGIKNYVTEKFKPSFIKIDGAIPFSEDKTWQYIEDPNKLSINTIRLDVHIVDIENLRFIKTTWDNGE